MGLCQFSARRRRLPSTLGFCRRDPQTAWEHSLRFDTHVGCPEMEHHMLQSLAILTSQLAQDFLSRIPLDCGMCGLRRALLERSCQSCAIQRSFPSCSSPPPASKLSKPCCAVHSCCRREVRPAQAGKQQQTTADVAKRVSTETC